MKIVNNNNMKNLAMYRQSQTDTMANYTFTTYWVEGAKEAIHQLHDAIANSISPIRNCSTM